MYMITYINIKQYPSYRSNSGEPHCVFLKLMQMLLCLPFCIPCSNPKARLQSAALN
jgi:hypothetical protein